ncbi:putative leader peptide [Streptomyces sp. NPDC054901]
MPSLTSRRYIDLLRTAGAICLPG